VFGGRTADVPAHARAYRSMGGESLEKEPSMSILSRTGSSVQVNICDVAAASVEERTEERSLYLTDGDSLYRFLGAAPGGLGEMVELEDCMSLVVTVVPIGDLRARRLRVVTPAADS
jgi:hypothetical protein